MLSTAVSSSFLLQELQRRLFADSSNEKRSFDAGLQHEASHSCSNNPRKTRLTFSFALGLLSCCSRMLFHSFLQTVQKDVSAKNTGVFDLADRPKFLSRSFGDGIHRMWPQRVMKVQENPTETEQHLVFDITIDNTEARAANIFVGTLSFPLARCPGITSSTSGDESAVAAVAAHLVESVARLFTHVIFRRCNPASTRVVHVALHIYFFGNGNPHDNVGYNCLRALLSALNCSSETNCCCAAVAPTHWIRFCVEELVCNTDPGRLLLHLSQLAGSVLGHLKQHLLAVDSTESARRFSVISFWQPHVTVVRYLPDAVAPLFADGLFASRQSIAHAQTLHSAFANLSSLASVARQCDDVISSMLLHDTCCAASAPRVAPESSSSFVLDVCGAGGIKSLAGITNSACSHVTELCLRATSITDADLRLISQLKRLRVLDVSHCVRLNSLTHLAHHPSLAVLDIACCPFLVSFATAVVSLQHTLRHFGCGCDPRDSTSAALFVRQQLSAVLFSEPSSQTTLEGSLLTSLSLWHLDQAIVPSAARSVSNRVCVSSQTTTLTLSECRQQTARLSSSTWSSMIGSVFPNLASLSLRRCDGIAGEAELTAMVAHLHNLTSISLHRVSDLQPLSLNWVLLPATATTSPQTLELSPRRWSFVSISCCGEGVFDMQRSTERSAVLRRANVDVFQIGKLSGDGGALLVG